MSKYNGDPDWDGCQAWNSSNAYSQHLQKQIATLRAELATAQDRIKHMEGVLIDAEELLGVEETGELITRPIARLQAELAAAQEIKKMDDFNISQHKMVTMDRFHKIQRLEAELAAARSVLIRVDEWWTSLPYGLRQDIEGSGAVSGCIAAVLTALQS